MIKGIYILNVTLLFLILTCFSYSKEIQIYIEEGKNYLGEERYFEAIGSFRNAINLNPNYAEAYYYLGKVYFLLEDYPTALNQALTGLKYANKEEKLILLAAECYREMGKYNEAEKFYNDAIKLYPASPDVLISLGEYYLRINKLSLCYDYLKKAERLSKNSDEVTLSLGKYFQAVGDTKKAEEYFKKAFNLNPYKREVFLRLGEFYFENENYLEAISILESGEKLFKNFYSGISLLAECYLKIGKENTNAFKKAIEKLEWLIQQSKNRDEKYLGELYYKMAVASEYVDFSKSVECYENAISLYPSNELFRYAYENFITKNTPLTNNIREELSKYHINKAGNLKNEGKLKAYLLHLKRAIFINPFSIEAREKLISYYESKSDFFNAYEELKKLSKIYNSSNIRDRMEIYEWKITKGQIKTNQTEYLPYSGLFLVENFPYNSEEVYSDVFNFYSQYFEKFKFSSLRFRKKEEISYILKALSEERKSFFVTFSFDIKKKFITLTLYDKVGKPIDKFFINFSGENFETTVINSLEWLDRYLPSIWLIKGKLADNGYEMSAGIWEGVKEGDEFISFNIVNMDIKQSEKLKATEVGYFSSIVVPLEEKDKRDGHKVAEIGKYIIKSKYFTQEYLTKWKRVLGY